VREGEGETADRLAAVVDYEEIVERVRRIPAKGHINLIETLAEAVAERCLKDARLDAMRIRIEKLERGPVRGVEIYRTRPVGP
jgi:dihydroneopterin aldolase